MRNEEERDPTPAPLRIAAELEPVVSPEAVDGMNGTDVGDLPAERAWFELRPRPPFNLELTAWALRRRAHNRIDRWDGGYERALTVGGRPCAVRVTQHGDSSGPILRVSVSSRSTPTAVERTQIESQLTRMLGLEVDLTQFYRLADEHPRTATLKDRFLGLRPPLFPTVFEALANAVANQQLSLEVGIELLNRFCEAFGAETSSGLRAFPTPESVVEASPRSLREMGFSWAKADYLVGLAVADLSGDLDPVRRRGATRPEVANRLMRLRGIGRWSAEYVMLRGLGRLNVFPGDDVGARNKLKRFLALTQPPSYGEIASMLVPWQPYSGMLYFHLLLDGLVERDALAWPRAPFAEEEC